MEPDENLTVIPHRTEGTTACGSIAGHRSQLGGSAGGEIGLRPAADGEP